MRKSELKFITEIWLKSFNIVKQELSNISNIPEKNESISKEIQILNSKLRTIIQTINFLSNEDQKIICYRYFDNMTYKNIAIILSLSTVTVRRRKEKALLSIGRIKFGFEDELIDTLIR